MGLWHMPTLADPHGYLIFPWEHDPSPEAPHELEVHILRIPTVGDADET